MKKRYITAAVILALCFALAACECKHEWKDATCDAPQICAKCEETQGTPLSHEWKDATGADPKTCSLCGDTQRKPMGHVWAEISCAAPVTCYDCGKTRGEALPHTWVEATCTTAKTCEVCGGTEGEALGHTPGEWKVNIPSLETLLQEISCSCTVCGEVIEEREEYLTVLHENGKYTLKASSISYRTNQLMGNTDIGKEYQDDANMFFMLDPNGTYYGRGLFMTSNYDQNGNFYYYYHGYPGSQMYMVLNFANGSELIKTYTDTYDTLYFMVDHSELGKAAQGIIPMAVDPTFTMEESIRFMDDLLNSDDGVEEHNGLKYYVEKKGAQYHVLVSIVE